MMQPSQRGTHPPLSSERAMADPTTSWMSAAMTAASMLKYTT